MDALQQPRNRRADRIGALASLPVFFDLKEKPVLVAGGSEGAAWKAELLAACGAEVHVFCPADALSDAMQALLHDLPLMHHDCDWQAAYFASFALALGDCAEDEAPLFHARATAAGVPVNVIDKPDYCRFKFGSIVNRSPVVIGISTDGAAPILGQAIRRRIEGVLPTSLAAWAGLAQALRNTVTALLPSPGQRRRFWERFVDRSFGEQPPATEEFEDLLAEAAAGALAERHGSVTFLEIGPEGADMLPLKAIRALQAADIILHDEGVDHCVLELVRREAARYALDRGNLDSAGSLARRHAEDGDRVVRIRQSGQAAAAREAREIGDVGQTAVEVVAIPAVRSSRPWRGRVLAGTALVRGHAQA